MAGGRRHSHIFPRRRSAGNASIDTQIAIWYQAWASVIESELNAGRFLERPTTRITQSAAARRFDQGLNHILTITDQGRKPINLEELLGTTTIMAYIAAYVFPDANLFELRQRLLLAFVPLQGSIDTELLIERATSLAEVFRRPWTEPSNPENRAHNLATCELREASAEREQDVAKRHRWHVLAERGCKAAPTAAACSSCCSPPSPISPISNGRGQRSSMYILPRTERIAHERSQEDTAMSGTGYLNKIAVSDRRSLRGLSYTISATKCLGNTRKSLIG